MKRLGTAFAACLIATAAQAQWQNAGPGSVGTTAPASTSTAGIAKCDGVTTTCGRAA